MSVLLIVKPDTIRMMRDGETNGSEMFDWRRYGDQPAPRNRNHYQSNREREGCFFSGYGPAWLHVAVAAAAAFKKFVVDLT